MAKLMTIIAAFLITTTCVAQQLKTYSGNYDINSDNVDILGFPPRLVNGTAQYTYYEDENLNRIKSGNFNYNGKVSNNGYSLSLSISGNYSKNIKNGNWSVKVSVSGEGNTVTRNYNGIFKDGFPNGLWSTTLTAIKKSKSETESCSMIFNNNIIQGEFKKISSEGINNISGSLDKMGYFTGKTIVKKGDNEYQFTFNNGLLLSLIGRNLQTGTIFENYKINEEELNAFNLLLIGKDSSIIDEIPYKIVDGNNALLERLVISELKTNFKEASLFDVTPGDLSNDEYNKSTWIGFKIRALEKSETKSERIKKEQEYNDVVKQADEYFNNFKFKEAKSIYIKVSNLKKNEEYPWNRIRLIEEMQRNPQKYLEIGANYQKNGKLDSAIYYCKVFDYFRPNTPSILNSIGFMYIETKQFSEALITFEKALSVTETTDPSYSYIVGNLAHSYLLTGNTEKAKGIYYLNKRTRVGNQSWPNMVVTDFNAFIDLGIKNEFYFEIAEKLGVETLLKKP
jgi:tetratricopeptide (TPR) repeat protein